MSETIYTADQIAGNPELYNHVYRFGRSQVQWECMGYGRQPCRRVRFSRIDLSTGKLRTITKYVNPDQPVILDMVASNE